MSALPTQTTDIIHSGGSSSVDLSSINANNLLNYSYGLVIGAGIGDSLGSYLEFTGGDNASDVIERAMTMPGGGTWGARVKPGQVTDDTELAVSLCRGLVDLVINNKKSKNHIYDSRYVAKQYQKWYNSAPFDIGGCTQSTLSEAPRVVKMKHRASGYNRMMKEHYKSSGNMANGSLMRCMPLIVYGYKLEYDQLYSIMTEDSSLTHANQTVYISNTAYGISAQYLLQTHGDKGDEEKNDDDMKESSKKRNRMAFVKAEEWLEQQVKLEKDNEEYKEVYGWLMDCKQNDISKLHSATKHIGFLKIALQRAFYHLWNCTDFETAMKSTISEGGDTDTNCCIVGGLIGALWGLDGIPKAFKDKAMNCVPSKPSRDDIFQTKMYINGKYIENIMENAPDTVQVKAYEIVEFESDSASD